MCIQAEKLFHFIRSHTLAAVLNTDNQFIVPDDGSKPDYTQLRCKFNGITDEVSQNYFYMVFVGQYALAGVCLVYKFKIFVLKGMQKCLFHLHTKQKDIFIG